MLQTTLYVVSKNVFIDSEFTKNQLLQKIQQLELDYYSTVAENATVQMEGGKVEKVFTKSHDRFLIIDDETVYHIGASLKDLAKKWFAFLK